MTKTLRLLATTALFTAVVSIADAQAPIRTPQQEENDIAMNRLDSAMGAYLDKHYSMKDDIEKVNIYGFESNTIPQYPDDVIKYRLSLLESPIPMDYNQYVKGFIDLYAVRKKKLTEHILTWSSYYFPIFEQILDQQGLPLEFKYLAVIESALNPNAVSWCGATGLWQFMYGTGLLYGLKINQFVDERKDPLKATLAACQYFKDMYAKYGDWLLVIAAYNCGPGNVSRAIRMSGGKKNFWQIMPYLPQETRGYVPAFIAAAYVMNYHQEHNIFPNPELQAVNYATDTVHVDSKVSFSQLSQSLGIDPDELKILNPSYKLGMIPYPVNQKNHVIRLPYRKAISFTDLKENIYASELQGYPSIRQSQVPSEPVVQPAAAADPMTTPEKQTLKDIHTPKKIAIKYYVKRGEALGTIAGKYQVTVNQVKSWNGLRSNLIHPGQSLTIWVTR